MNGKFPKAVPEPGAEMGQTGKSMPYTFALDEIRLRDGSEGADEGNSQFRAKRYDTERRDKVMKKHAKASADYVNVGRPLDLRYAQKVHGAALAPPWEFVWTDDTEVSTDVRANMMESEIRKAVTEIITNDMKLNLQRDTMTRVSNSGVPLYAVSGAVKENIESARKRARELIPRDTATSRLSNLVLDLEEVAVTRMRNLAMQAAKRGHVNGYRMVEVVHQLDLARYNYDVRVLCRSLHRDDLTFSTFGHLVGTLLCESLYTKGTHAVNYMQLRIQRSRIGDALQEAVGFLLEINHPVEIDEIGQPDGKQIFARGKSKVFVVGDSSPDGGDSGGEERSEQPGGAAMSEDELRRHFVDGDFQLGPDDAADVGVAATEVGEPISTRKRKEKNKRARQA